MTPPVLRCESRRPGGLGMWRYSVATLIVVAAILDALWWVPAHQGRRHHRPHYQVQPTVSRCHH